MVVFLESSYCAELNVTIDKVAKYCVYQALHFLSTAGMKSHLDRCTWSFEAAVDDLITAGKT